MKNTFDETRSFEYIILDTSTLIEFHNKRVDFGTEIKNSGPKKPKFAITETVLLEFLGFLGENKGNFCDDKKSFLIENRFYVIPTLHFLVKEECFGLKAEQPREVESVIEELENANPQSLKKLKEVHDEKLGLCKGNDKAPTITNDLQNNVFKNFEKELADTLSKYSRNLLLPMNNDPIPYEVLNNKEFYKSQMHLNLAIEEAKSLVNNHEFIEFLIVSSDKTYLITPREPKIIEKKYDGILKDALPYTFRLLFWKYVHDLPTKSKKGEDVIIADRLEKNCANDIEIFLNSISTKNLFVTADKGLIEYLKLIFNDKLKGKLKIKNSEEEKQHHMFYLD